MTATAQIADSAPGSSVRITDNHNTPSPDATVVDFPFRVPVDCTPAPPAGSSCGFNTSVNALQPGLFVVTGTSQILELGEVQFMDAGTDGTAGTGDDTLFAVQGIFAP